MLLLAIVPATQLHVNVDARGSKGMHVIRWACMWGKAALDQNACVSEGSLCDVVESVWKLLIWQLGQCCEHSLGLVGATIWADLNQTPAVQYLTTLSPGSRTMELLLRMQ